MDQQTKAFVQLSVEVGMRLKGFGYMSVGKALLLTSLPFQLLSSAKFRSKLFRIAQKRFSLSSPSPFPWLS